MAGCCGVIALGNDGLRCATCGRLRSAPAPEARMLFAHYLMLCDLFGARTPFLITIASIWGGHAARHLAAAYQPAGLEG